MRMLFIVHHFPPDVNSTGILMAQVTADLLARGHEVTVVTTMPHYEGFKTWPSYRRKRFVRESLNGVDVRRVWSFTNGSKTMIPRLINYLTFNLMAFMTTLRAGPFDVIFATNGSFFSGVTGHLAARLKRAPFVYNLQDLYPDVPIRAGQLTNKTAIAILRAVERYMYRKADRLTVITPSFARTLEGRGVPASKMEVVPNFVDVDVIRPLEKDNEFSRAHGLVDRFVISHAGNIGYVYGLETLLDAAASMREREEIVFLIVGNGVAKPALEAKVAAEDLHNVVFLPFQPSETVPLIRAASDVQVALYRHGAGTESMPSKVYEIMASARPVLAGAEEDSDLCHLVRSEECGLCVPPEDVDALTAAIVDLFANPEMRATMGARGRSVAEETYSRAAVVDRYERMLGGR